MLFLDSRSGAPFGTSAASLILHTIRADASANKDLDIAQLPESFKTYAVD